VREGRLYGVRVGLRDCDTDGRGVGVWKGKGDGLEKGVMAKVGEPEGRLYGVRVGLRDADGEGRSDGV